MMSPVLGDVCLLQQCLVKPQVKHLKVFNQLVNRAILKDVSLMFRSVGRDIKFIVFTDAAWANASGHASQAGWVVFQFHLRPSQSLSGNVLGGIVLYFCIQLQKGIPHLGATLTPLPPNAHPTKVRKWSNIARLSKAFPSQ